MNIINISLGLTVLGVNVFLILMMKMTRAAKERSMAPAELKQLKPLKYTWNYIGVVIGAAAIMLGVL